MNLTCNLRQGLPSDLTEIQQLFVRSINTACVHDYDAAQRRVWSSSIKNKERWNDILCNQYLIVAEVDNIVVGFASSDKDYLDTLFVHNEYQRTGIAKKLFDAIEKRMNDEGREMLNVQASKTALPFFEAMGCTIVNEQTLNIKGVPISNYGITKVLTAI